MNSKIVTAVALVIAIGATAPAFAAKGGGSHSSGDRGGQAAATHQQSRPSQVSTPALLTQALGAPTCENKLANPTAYPPADLAACR